MNMRKNRDKSETHGVKNYETIYLWKKHSYRIFKGK